MARNDTLSDGPETGPPRYEIEAYYATSAPQFSTLLDQLVALRLYVTSGALESSEQIVGADEAFRLLVLKIDAAMDTAKEFAEFFELEPTDRIKWLRPAR